MKRSFIFLLSSFLFACVPAPSSPLPLVDVYASPAAQPFLEELYACADEASITLNITAESPQIQLRLGFPDGWEGSAFQVGVEELLAAASLHSPLPSLTPQGARELFAGRGDPSVQVWAYAADSDAQKEFESALLDGQSVTSRARLALSPAHMVEALTADPNAVGILPRRWMTAGLRELLVVASVPVLALTPSEPQGAARDLIACMQQ